MAMVVVTMIVVVHDGGNNTACDGDKSKFVKKFVIPSKSQPRMTNTTFLVGLYYPMFKGLIYLNGMTNPMLKCNQILDDIALIIYFMLFHKPNAPLNCMVDNHNA